LTGRSGIFRGSDFSHLFKVREAGMGRVPYVIVIGDDEIASKNLTVTVRKKSEPNKPFKEQLTIEALIAAVKGYGRKTVPPALYSPEAFAERPVYLILFSLAGLTGVLSGEVYTDRPHCDDSIRADYLYPEFCPGNFVYRLEGNVARSGIHMPNGAYGFSGTTSPE
jgi:hypothetical protein